MLTRRQNMLETLKGGNPDRYVNQYEALSMMMLTPYTMQYPVMPDPGGPAIKNGWGVWNKWPAGTPGPFPLHDDEHLLCKDITKWRDYIKAPELNYTEADWAPAIAEMEKIDRNEYFAAIFVAPGIFEQTHHFQEIQKALVNYFVEPEYTAELINYIADWEIAYAEQVCKYLKPDVLFHHDDWGSQASTFISPDMFEEFLVPAYKRVYSYYKEHGVELIVHHSDSYAATLVPYMIEMGVDVWQGCMSSNNVPELIEKYGGEITFMGAIDSAMVDYPGWTPEAVEEAVRKVCDKCGTKYYIPCITQGLGISTFPGVYDSASDAINKISKEKF